MDTVIPKLSEEITRLKAENEGYPGIAKDLEDAKETIDRLTSALARAHEALKPVFEEIKNTGNLYRESDWNPDAHIDKPITLTVKEARKIIQCEADPTGKAALERWKDMEAVVEAARACYEEDDFITENSPGSFERDKKLGEALEALDEAKGEEK